MNVIFIILIVYLEVNQQGILLKEQGPTSLPLKASIEMIQESLYQTGHNNQTIVVDDNK